MNSRLRSEILATVVATGLALCLTHHTCAQAAPTNDGAPVESVDHPALFLVGDSIMRTGVGDGEKGPWGWGSEIGHYFDPAKIHVYNRARGGRSSRSFIEEGAWQAVLDQLQPGDFVLVGFGHNDSANSRNHPDRTTINSNGDEVLHVGYGETHHVVRTYGSYLRQYAADARARGATVILCSPAPRNTWTDGRIKRGFDGYARWAAEAAREAGVSFIDLNTIACDRFDALGQEATRALFSDLQHTTKAGARINAESVVAAIRQLVDCPLATALVPYPDAKPDR